jgi:autotransporter-associated beta strand protein
LNVVKHPIRFDRQPLLGRKSLWPIACVFLSALACALRVNAQDGYWVNSSGGNWSNAGNWDAADGVAGGTDNTAYFGFGPEGSIAPNSSFTVDGPQTVGNLFFTTQGGSGNWTFNSGLDGSITLNNTFGPSEITVTTPGLQVNLNTALAGGNGVEKDGAGKLALGGANTYNGQTMVNGGGLEVNGSLASGGVDVNNGTLSGSGVINGPVVVNSGGMLSLNNSSGPLSINNSLVLNPGSTTVATIGGPGPLVQGLSSVTYGGTLIVNAPGNVLLGQSFSIFGSVPTSGNFSSIQPPPGPWMRWEFDPTSGRISVVSSASQPHFANVGMNGGKLAFQLSGGPPGAPCYILASTSLTLPMSAWTRVATNAFDVSGNCCPTNAVHMDGSGEVYLTAFIIPTP